VTLQDRCTWADEGILRTVDKFHGITSTCFRILKLEMAPPGQKSKYNSNFYYNIFFLPQFLDLSFSTLPSNSWCTQGRGRSMNMCYAGYVLMVWTDESTLSVFVAIRDIQVSQLIEYITVQLN